MKPAKNIFAALLAFLIFCLPRAAADSGAADLDAVARKAAQLVHERFYDPGRLADFDLRLAAAGRPPAARLTEALAALQVSHTGWYRPDQIDYYELADIFSFAFRQERKRLFPPDGQVRYAGIGMIAQEVDGGLFVTDVYDGGPAALAGVLRGDELLAVDGAPYREIASFAGKLGQKVRLRLRRQKDAPPIDLAVTVAPIEPDKAFTAAISASIRIIDHEGRKIGYIRLWSFTSEATRDLLNREIGEGRLKAADALVVDLRSRWGGAPPDAAEIFVGGTPNMQMIIRKPEPEIASMNVRWTKPVVAIIDEGTRSGLEVFAYALKRGGIPLVGERTAGAVLGGSVFLLPDDSLLLLAVGDVRIDGTRLEGAGVAPDVEVVNPVAFAAGDDPQLASALAAAVQGL